MVNLNSPLYYNNREISWLEFNERVLEEAQDKSNRVLERMKFLAITSSNLDEFFMVRVSGLWELVEAGYNKPDYSGLTPKEQLAIISSKVHKLVNKQYSCLSRSIIPILEKNNIFYVDYGELSKEQKKFVKDYFNDTLFPILTPMAVDQSRPFPLLANKSLNVLVQLDAHEDELYAVIQVPGVLPRLLELPASDKRVFILIEEIIKIFAGQLFQGHTVREANAFRITRNSDLEIDEEDSDDLLIEIERSIKRRKWGEPVRLEVEKIIEQDNLSFLMKALELDKDDIYQVSGPLDLTFLFAASAIRGYDELRNEPIVPQPSIGFMQSENVFDCIKNNDILVHHPYESFDCVINFVKSASVDPRVLAIKQTLYRVGGNSPIVEALIQAAENGKQVTVIIELKARFDEENNIIWAKKLEKAGCHVIYGLVGLKTHCKICLVVRKEDDGMYRYVHFSTGNYNDNTAKIYTDLGFFTAKETFGSDVSALFNVLTGYSQPPDWKKLAVAPTSIRSTFISLIENEIINAKKGLPTRIVAKLNSLVDAEIIQALYRASCAGVKINLIVRGMCSLRPGIAGVSENITVISIIDRFLEHSRIYFFENGGNNKIYLSSADWMPRNFDRRVEIAFPVEQHDLMARIVDILNITLSDTVKVRVGKSDGSYERKDRRGKEKIQSQLVFLELAEASVEQYKEENFGDIFVPIDNISDEL